MKIYVLKHQSGFPLGSAVEKRDGWYFYPNVCGKAPSRKPHPTADACLPAWAKRHLHMGASFLPKEDAHD